MTTQSPRFVGFAAAFVAGTLFSSTIAVGQEGVGSRNGRGTSSLLFDASLRSGISGVVRDRAGRPQVGALVELLSTESHLLARTFTDDRGHYTLPGLNAGSYQVQASNSLFLPALRPDLRLLAHSKAIVNLTLSTVSDALDWLPAQPRDPHAPSDDWDWTLRLATNRPLLRFRDPESPDGTGTERVVVEGDAGPSTLLVVQEGTNQFGQGGLGQQFAFREPSEGDRAILFRAEISSGFGEQGFGLSRIAATAAYRQQLTPDRSWTTVATLSERSAIHSASDGDGLTTMQIRSGSTMRVGDLLQVDAGTEIEGARLGGGPATLVSHPFAILTLDAGQTTIEYRVSTAPSMTGAEALDGKPEAPALIENNGRLAFEEGRHQELRFRRKLRAGWTAEAAVFDDQLQHPVVQGSLQQAVAGSEAAIDSENVLYDPGTGIIAVSGQGYSHGGVMGLLRDQLSPDTWLSLRYALGDAESLALPSPQTSAQALPSFEAHPASSVMISGGTRLPVTHTALHAGYHWQSGGTVTEVAPFLDDREDPGAYLGFSLRQPIHLQGSGHRRLQAVLDVRNLLAQGYRPFLSKDGTMVYFAQSQRCLAAGFAFSF